jgi:recombination protein RecA
MATNVGSETREHSPIFPTSGIRGACREKGECSLVSLPTFAARLTEISASVSGAPLTLTFRLVLDAQRRAEPVAWIGRKDAPFYPPDAADTGVDLAALVVVWTGNAITAAKAADLLVRSGAFGLVVLDLGSEARLPMHATSRLAMLARQHDAAIVCLTNKDAARPSLGPLVSLRAHTASRARGEVGRFRCEVAALKDKRGGTTWNIVEVCRGPDGLH